MKKRYPLAFGAAVAASAAVWLNLPVRCDDDQWNRVAMGTAPHLGSTLYDVNHRVNHEITYREDTDDYWQSPRETLRRGEGDCEDFAILKRAALLSAGWRDDQMLIVVVQDTVARRAHAILIVDGYVLDNRTDYVLPVEQFPGYIPVKAYQRDDCWAWGTKA